MPVWLSYVVLLAYVASVFGVGIVFALLGERLCLLVKCLARAHLLAESVDLGSRPCDNFYQFTCGKLVQANATGKEQGVSTVQDQVKRKQLWRIANYLYRPLSIQDHWVLRMSKMLYRNCVDPTERIDREGPTQFEDAIMYTGGFPLLLPSWNEVIRVDDEELNARNAGLGTAHFYEVRVSTFYSNSEPIVRISVPQALKKISYPSFDVQVQFVTELYKVMSGNNTVPNDIQVEINNTVQFKQKLLEATKSERQGLKETYYFVDFEYWNYELELAHLEVLDSIHKTVGPVKVIDMMIGSGFNYYIKALDDLLGTTNYRILKNYSVIEHVLAHIRFLPKIFRDLYNRYMITSEDSLSEIDRNPKLICANILVRKLATTLSSIYVRRYFPTGIKHDSLNALTSSVRASTKSLIRKVRWMSASDKRDTNAKVDLVTVKTPFPDEMIEFFTNESKFEEHSRIFCFSNVTVLDDLLSVSTAVDVANIMFLNITSEGRSEYQEHYDMFSTDIYYERKSKALVVPIGLLQYPSYDQEWPKYLNYAGFGTILLHELIRGLDFSGANFGSNDLEKEWSNFTMTRYDEKRKCFLNQYNKHVLPLTGVNVTSLLDIRENMEFTTAVAILHRAYNDYAKYRFFHEGKLKNWQKHTVDQLFFINYATYFCFRLDKEYSKGMTEEEVTRPSNEYKVVVSLMNYPRFSEAFGCKEGQGMNPKDKCLVL